MTTTRAGVGLSLLPEAGEAAREAASRALAWAGCRNADWALLFATSPHRPHYQVLLQEIRGALGTDRVAGCSAWGVIAGTEEIEGPAAVAVLAVRSERIRGDALFAPIHPEQPLVAASEIHRQARLAPGEGLLVLLPDPFAARPDELLGALERLAPGLEAVGGACSGDPAAQGTFQFYGRNVATRSLAGVRLSGALRRVIGVTQGCQPLGEVCRVTRGDGNVILELDGRPALDVLRSRLPAALRESLPRLGTHLALGWPPDPLQEDIPPGEYLVRPLIGADPGRGALVAGATARGGQPLYLVLREPHAAREDLKEMLRSLRPEATGLRYAFGLYFNCAGRGTSLHGVPGIDTAYISGALGEIPLVGFFGNAEIAPLRGRNRVFTYSGVLVLLAEEG
jgi:small ligand-binding sensory domain FIST